MKSTKRLEDQKIRGRSTGLTAIILMLFVFLMSVTVSAAGERATFDRGSTVRSKWTALAGGSRNNVTEIRQYKGNALPEGVTTQIVSASNSETLIYSWFDNGTIYYWSEDTHPYTNADASYWFNGFTEVTVIDSAPFDTSKTTDMEAMFANCSKLKKLDVSGFDTSNVRCMYCMFYNDAALEELDVSHFNTARTTGSSDDNYGSLCGMFMNCSKLKMLDLSSFDMTATSWSYHTQNMFTGCSSFEKLVLGPKNWFNSYTNLSGSWTHTEDGVTLSGGELMRSYTSSNAISYAGTWIRNLPEGHYYRTDGSLGQENMWEVHTPSDKFKGYCLNLNKYGVGDEYDRVSAETDADITKILCTEEQGSTHGYAPLGSSLKEALITLIYYGWPNDAAGIQNKYGLSDQDYMEVTQNAIWDFTDRYDDPAGPSHYSGSQLAAYNELVAQRFSNIEGEYLLFLYKAWDKDRQNLLSIMGVDNDVYGGVCVRKQNANGTENLAGAVFTIYDEDGNEVEEITTGATGTAYACRTDHSKGLPMGEYTIKETVAPAGYELSDIIFHFKITEPNVIVTDGWYQTDGVNPVMEEIIYYDDKDDNYKGGGVGIYKKSDTGKMLVGAEFEIINSDGETVKKLVTNDAGVAKTGAQDLPLGTYTVKETKAPEGHVLPENASQTVEITENMQFKTLTFVDTEKKGSITLRATKKMKDPDQTLEAGKFTFQLLDAKGNVIQEKTNDAEGNIVFDAIAYTPDDLGYANYHIREVLGDPDEYRYDRHEEDVTVTIYDTGGDTLSCEAVYDSDGAEFVNAAAGTKYKVQFSKKKLNSDKQIAGAKLELRDQAGRLIKSWTSTTEPYELELEPGKYIIHETDAPEGYYKRSDLRFEITEEGELVCKEGNTCDQENRELNIFDSTVSSTGLTFRKIDADTKSPLEGAKFTLKGTDEADAGYSKTVTTGIDGILNFDDLETGTYELTEDEAPYAHTSEDSPWTVTIQTAKEISKTPNIDANGTASDNHPNDRVMSDTVTLAGSPEKIHVELKYQTEDGYDYLIMKDADGNVITKDAGGNTIGDTSAGHEGYIWGGLSEGKIRELSFDLSGDTVKFEFHADPYENAYGYYAVVSSDTLITVKNSKDEEVPLNKDDGLYDLPNKAVDLEAAKAEIKAAKVLKGRDWKEDDSFTFELKADDKTYPMPEKTELTVKDSEEASFGEMTFDKEGIYTYAVKEKPGDLEGVTYDDTSHKVTIRVEDADLDCKLEATVTYEDSDSETSAVITNTYEKEDSGGGSDSGGDDSGGDDEETDSGDTPDSGNNADDETSDTIDKPNAGTPNVASRPAKSNTNVNTGDSVHIGVWSAVMALAMIFVLIIVFFRRRSEIR